MIQFKYISREKLKFPRFRFHLFPKPETGYFSASLLLVGAGAVYVFSVFLFQLHYSNNNYCMLSIFQNSYITEANRR